MVFIAFIKPQGQKQHEKERVSLVYRCSNPWSVEVKVETEMQELKQTIEKCCLLTCSPWSSQFAFLYTSGPLAQDWYQSQCAGTSHTNTQSRKGLLTDLMVAFSLLRFLVSDNFSLSSVGNKQTNKKPTQWNKTNKNLEY